MNQLAKHQLDRFHRNILLKSIGVEGQKKLIKGKVLVIGAGGLGSPALYYLAAAGVGAIGVADPDKVDLSNLQRQILHTMADLDRLKVISAKEKLLKLYPDIRIDLYPEYLDSPGLETIIQNYDFIIDATDNFRSKFMINDICLKHDKAFSHAGVSEFEGQMMTVLPGRSACYRCVFQNPPNQDDIEPGIACGILGGVAGTIGSLQSIEAVKYLTGAGALLLDQILVFDALTFSFRKVQVGRREGCCR